VSVVLGYHSAGRHYLETGGSVTVIVQGPVTVDVVDAEVSAAVTEPGAVSVSVFPDSIVLDS